MTTVVLPTGMSGCRYVVSNLTARTEIAVSDDGGCILPLGAKVGVCAVPEAGYVIVGTNPYVIENITLKTTVDENELPKVPPTVKINEVKSIDTWDGEKGPVAVDYTLAGLNTNLEYKVAFDITAGGRTASVTNAAALLSDGRQTVVTNDTAALFGEVVVDDAVMKLSLIALKPKSSEVSELEEVVESVSEKPFLLGLTGVVLPTEMIVYDYVVSNLTDAAEIVPRADGRYALPLGARVGVYAVAEEGYVIVGTNPYVIEKVASDTTVDADLLPKVAPTVILRNVEAPGPWDDAKGLVAVDYSLAGLEADRWYKVAFEITAGGRTAGVTNLEAKLSEGKRELKLIETVPLFGEEIVDNDATVKLSLIAVNPIPEGQLWDDGPVWAESNLGESGAVDHPEYGALYDFDGAINAVSELGDGWRLPTGAEFEKLIDTSAASVCTRKWDDDRKGWTFTGTGVYSSNSVFLPAAGFAAGTGGSRSQAGTGGVYRSSSSDGSDSARILFFGSSDATVIGYGRSVGGSVRVVKDAGSGSEAVKSTDEAVFRLGPEEVLYRDYDPETGTFTNAFRVCTFVTSETRTLEDGWYAVKDDVAIPAGVQLVIRGTVHLILCDGAKLSIEEPGVVPSGEGRAAVRTTLETLVIYAQTEGTGALVAKGGAGDPRGYGGAGIGGDGTCPGGEVTINGGTVTAIGGEHAAGIGGGDTGWGGEVTINGGTVTAKGGDHAMDIGSGAEGSGRTLTISGGAINASNMDGSIAISGGIFSAKPKDGWIESGRCRAPNMDVDTGETYPWRVVASNAVVTPDSPLGPYETAAEATNVMAAAVFLPSEEVLGVLSTGAARGRYAGWFGLDVAPKAADEWYVEAALTDAAKSNLAASAADVTRQIPLSAIAALADGATLAVTATNGVPGFYYTLHGGAVLTGIVPDAANRDVLCGADGEVVFPAVGKLSDAAGFFRVGVDATTEDSK